MIKKNHDVHILGNGSSVKFYTDTGCLNVIACNIPQHGHRYTVLSIIDQQPVVWMSNNNWHPYVPVMCSKKAKRASERYDIKGDWQCVHEDRYRSNSAHWAAQYAVKHNPSTVHLWGMDSMYSDDYSSQMDNIVPRPQRPNLNREWHPYWREIFDANKHITFVIHTPVDAKLQIKSSNIIQKTHKTVHYSSII